MVFSLSVIELSMVLFAVDFINLYEANGRMNRLESMQTAAAAFFLLFMDRVIRLGVGQQRADTLHQLRYQHTHQQTSWPLAVRANRLPGPLLTVRLRAL